MKEERDVEDEGPPQYSSEGVRTQLMALQSLKVKQLLMQKYQESLQYTLASMYNINPSTVWSAMALDKIGSFEASSATAGFSHPLLAAASNLNLDFKDNYAHANPYPLPVMQGFPPPPTYNEWLMYNGANRGNAQEPQPMRDLGTSD